MNVSGFSFWYPMLMSITIFLPDPWRLVYVLCNAFESVLLVLRFYLGGVLGSFIHFNTEGLDFVLTALFVVIFLEQWLKDKDHTSSILGIVLSLLCLIAFGADDFMIPSMIAIAGVLTLLRKPLEKGGETA